MRLQVAPCGLAGRGPFPHAPTAPIERFAERAVASHPQHSQEIESAREPLLHTRGISKARSFDLEVTPWAPTRLTSCIFHPGPEEASGASTLEPGPAQQFRRVNFPPDRLASLQRARLSSASPKLQPDRGGQGAGSGYPSVLIS